MRASCRAPTRPGSRSSAARRRNSRGGVGPRRSRRCRVSADALRLAVIGVGHLGRHHARIAATLDGVRLTAVVDLKAERAAEIAAATQSTPLTDYRELFDRVDAVVVAVPTEAHLAVAAPFLERGVG